VREIISCDKKKSVRFQDAEMLSGSTATSAPQRFNDSEHKLHNGKTRILKLLCHMKASKALETEPNKIYMAADQQLTELKEEEDGLRLRVKHLENCLETTNNEVEFVIKALMDQLHDVMQELEDEQNNRAKLETELKLTQERMTKMKEKGAERIWTELEATKLLLKAAENQRNIFEEKVKFMETVNKAAKEDIANLQETCDKYAVEMSRKDEQLKQMQEEVKELTGSLSRTQEENVLLRENVQEYEEWITTHENNCSENAHMEQQDSELPQQVLDLQASLSQVIYENEQLQEALNQKQLDIVEKDNQLCMQSKFAKAHNDLIVMQRATQNQQNKQIIALQSALDEQHELAAEVQEKTAAEVVKLQTLYRRILEKKHMKLNYLKEALKKMLLKQDTFREQQKLYEAYIAELECALQEKENPSYVM
jgi:phage terminase small subunit